MHHILIVDEEEHLLWALEKNLLPDRDDVRVWTAADGEQGMTLLQDEPIDVLICDIKMPGKVDGFQLILRAKEVAPDARVVIMTAFGTNRIQNLADRMGVTHYIEKPFQISELRRLVGGLLDTAEEGFQGVLSDLELTDIVQMLCLAKRTALLHLKHREHRGKIVFERGDVAHAEFDDLEGQEAVYKMLALRQGDIYMQSDFHNARRTIDLGWQDLLLEGVRRADEAKLEEAEPTTQQSTFDSESSHPFPLGLEASASSEDSSPRFPPTHNHHASELGGVSSGAEVAPGKDLGEESSGGAFFSEEELEEIEQAGRGPKATANGFDHIEDSGVRELIARHSLNQSSGAQNTESSSFARTTLAPPQEDPGFSSFPGKPTDSSDYETPVPAKEPPKEPASATPLFGQDLSGELPLSAPQPSHGFPKASSTQPFARQPSATVMLETPNMLSSRSILADFLKDCPGLRTSGIFSFEDGLALDFVQAHGSPYEGDMLAAFFRDVAACAEQVVQVFHAQHALSELQITLEHEIVLINRVKNTPYVHIAVMDASVRLGLATVMMRRTSERLSECFGIG